jgi:hypothetical protein
MTDEKNLELKRYLDGHFETGVNSFNPLTTYMPPGSRMYDFHDVCKSIGFGIDKGTQFLFDGRNEPGHRLRWKATLYGPMERGLYSRDTAVTAGFNRNMRTVEASWKGTYMDMLRIFDTIGEGELITPVKLDLMYSDGVMGFLRKWALGFLP